MTPKQRLFARLEGKRVDSIPNMNIVMLFAARHAGIRYGEYCSDYRALVEAQQKTAFDFSLDILSTMSDPFRETYDYGAKISYRDDDLPVCEDALLKEPSDLKRLLLFDPLKSTRILDRIRAIELFKKNNGDDFPILGWVEAPFAEFCDLTTVTEGMAMLYDEPEFVEDALHVLAEQAVRCAKAQIDAGADIIGMGDAVASLVSPTTYKTLCMPTEKHIIDIVHQMGIKTKLHICGNINHILPDMIETGASIVDIDYMVDFGSAVKLADGRCSICGNVDPVEILLQGTPEQIREQTRLCIEAGDDRCLISGGCEVPKFTPDENLKAVGDELHSIA